MRYTQASYIPDLRDGKVLGFFVLVTDITERKAAEVDALNAKEKLRSANENLEKQVEERTEHLRRAKVNAEKLAEDRNAALLGRERFFAIASHELQTPLTTLILQNSLCLRVLENIDDVSSPSRYRRLKDFVEGNQNELDRLSRLIEDMLSVSRIGSGLVSLRPARVDLCVLTRSVLARFEPRFACAGYSVSSELCPSLIGEWDGERIEQVIENLLTNAMKYGAKKPVLVRVMRQGEFAVVSVQDNGIGIASEDLERIFRLFERAISTSEVSGLGVGLYVAREIVEAHGGEIWVESVLGSGAEFVVRLPLLC